MRCYSEKESSLGFGRDDGASLAGKESAIVLSSIFSRFAFELAGSTTRSSGSLPRFFAADLAGGAAFLRTTFPDSCARSHVDPVWSGGRRCGPSVGSRPLADCGKLLFGGSKMASLPIGRTKNQQLAMTKVFVKHSPKEFFRTLLEAHRWTLHLGF
jgi:hypothetical protein